MSETNNETAVRSRTTSTTSPSKAKLTPLVPGKEDLNRPLVELTHVEKHFGALHVLKDINLTVTKGEVLVVVGPSGSGKSTMCRTINRLETIDSGDIRIDGKPLPQEGKELANLRAEVGMVFQSFNLFANKTILENVTLALIKVRHMDKKEAEQLAMDLLARVGVDSQASKMPSQLSGGHFLPLLDKGQLPTVIFPRLEGFPLDHLQLLLLRNGITKGKGHPFLSI